MGNAHYSFAYLCLFLQKRILKLDILCRAISNLQNQRTIRISCNIEFMFNLCFDKVIFDKLTLYLVVFLH